MNAWRQFSGKKWQDTINVRDFIQKNYTEYQGDDSFLVDATEATQKLWSDVLALNKEELARGGVLDMDGDIISTITSHTAGYLDQDLEKIVGLQTDKPLKRSFQPFGGIRVAKNACEEFGYTVDPKVKEIFTKYRKTHNQGVFDVYTDEMRAA